MKEENEELEPCNHVTMVSVYSTALNRKPHPFFQSTMVLSMSTR